MRKLVAVAVLVLVLGAVGAAVDQHGPQRTGKVAVEFDDTEVAGWKTVTIPAVAIEQGEYREGNEAPQEKKVAGQPTYDDLEMERGVKIVQHDQNDYTIFLPDGTPVRAKTVAISAAGSETGLGLTVTDGDGGTATASVFAPLAEPERARANGRKTVRPEDLVAVATGHGDDVSAAASEFYGQTEYGDLTTIATRNDDGVRAVAGTVKWFDEEKGYGFVVVTDDDGASARAERVIKKSGVREAIVNDETEEDIFVHVSGLIDDIQEDDRVTFEVEEGDRGPIAVDVELSER